jgi:hypothetical protein
MIPLLGSVSLLAIVLLLYILARLSERFGAVIKMQPLYRYYYPAGGLISFSFLIHLVVINSQLIPGLNLSWLTASWLLLLVYYLPLGVGLTISLIVTWRYWSWLVTEGDG